MLSAGRPLVLRILPVTNSTRYKTNTVCYKIKGIFANFTSAFCDLYTQ